MVQTTVYGDSARELLLLSLKRFREIVIFILCSRIWITISTFFLSSFSFCQPLNFNFRVWVSLFFLAFMVMLESDPKT